MTPEKLHVALVHVPIVGLALALIPLLWGIFARNRTAQLIGILLAALSAWTTPLLMGSGEDAGERYEDGPVARHLDDDAARWIEAHDERAHTGSKALYGAAALATLALAAAALRPPLGRPAAIITSLAAAAGLAASLWIADSGGQIRRPDFRPPTAPAP